MSLYRQPGRTRATLLAAVAAGALAVGLVGGFAAGRSSAGDPSAADAVAHLRERLRPVANGLELLPTEYPQALGGTGDEAAAVRGDLDRIRSALRAASADLRALDPRGAAALDSAVGDVEAAIGRQAAPAEVERLAGAASAALRRVPGGR